MTSTAWDDDGLEDWERDLTRPDGFPLVATAVGAGVIIAVAAVALSAFDIDVAGHVGWALGGAMLVAGMVFAIAWLATLRHATLGWKVVAGGVFAGVALMGVVAALAVDAGATQADARTVRLIRIDGKGEPVLPPGVKAGPITAASMDFLRDAIAERHRRDALTHDLGLDRLANASAVGREPGLVRDCGRFARNAPRIDEMDRTFVAKSRAFRARLGGIVKDPAMRDAMLKEFDGSMGANAADLAEANRLTHRLFDQAGPLCTLLSARRWKPMGAMFMFASQGDLAAFDRLIKPWNDLIREAQAVAFRQDMKMRESGLVDGNSRF